MRTIPHVVSVGKVEYCGSCGTAVGDKAEFCGSCGARVQHQAVPPPTLSPAGLPPTLPVGPPPPLPPMGVPSYATPPPRKSRAGRIALVVLVVVIVVAAVAVVALRGLLSTALSPPVAVYSRPTPSSTDTPESIIPGTAAGRTRIDLQTNTFSNAVDALGTYDGDIFIEVTRFVSSGDASSYLNSILSDFEGQSGSRTSVSAADQHWFAFTGSGESIFTWRKGIWVFVVIAPSESLRNQVANELQY